MGRVGTLTARVLGGLATVRQTPEGTPGPLLGPASTERPGQRTSGTIRHREGLGLGGFARPCEPHRDAAAGAGPPREGHAPKRLFEKFRPLRVDAT
jgi:hypothetical protein